MPQLKEHSPEWFDAMHKGLEAARARAERAEVTKQHMAEHMKAKGERLERRLAAMEAAGIPPGHDTVFAVPEDVQDAASARAAYDQYMHEKAQQPPPPGASRLFIR